MTDRTWTARGMVRPLLGFVLQSRNRSQSSRESSVGKVSEFRENWVALLGCCLGIGVGMGALFFYTSGAFLTAITAELGWSTAKYSSMHLVHAIAIAIAAPLAGALIDRIGVLPVIAIGFAGEGLGFLLLAIAPMYFELFITIHLLLAFFGVGSTAVTFTRIIAERFEKMRGLALAIAVSGVGVAAVVGPPITTFVNTNYGWRAGYLMLAAVVFVGGPISLWLIRRSSPRSPILKDRISLKATMGSFMSIIRQPILWMLLLVIFVFVTSTNGYVVHLIKLLTGQGMSAVEAAQIQSIVGLSIIFGRLGAGVLVDRFFAPWIAAAFMLFCATAFIGIASADPAWRIAAAIGLGLTVGAELDLAAYLVSRYFRIEDFGKTFGLVYATAIISSGSSPLLIALVAEHGGGYSTALAVSAMMALACAALVLFAPRFPGTQERRA